MVKRSMSGVPYPGAVSLDQTVLTAPSTLNDVSKSFLSHSVNSLEHLKS